MTRSRAFHFAGFSEDAGATTTLPEAVFTDLLPHLDDPDLLKVVLLVLWRLAKMRADGAPWVTDQELRADPVLREALTGDGFADRLSAALKAAIDAGILLHVPWERADGRTEQRYFANSPKGRATVAAIRRGVSPERAGAEARPNIFTLYEQNIGSLTALLSEDLMEAEATYPADWIEDAFHEAVRLNIRNWKYILAILERWQAEGRDEIDRGTSRRSEERSREEKARRYIEDAYDRIVRH
jgi:DNA replication protein